jgi:outer membrane protein TolC
VGLSTNFQVLQFQQDLTQRRREEVVALTAYKIDIANLERAQGTTLDTLNVDFLGE